MSYKQAKGKNEEEVSDVELDHAEEVDDDASSVNS